MLRAHATFFGAANESVPSNGTTSATGIPTRSKDCAIVITASAPSECPMKIVGPRSPTIARGNFAYDCLRFGVIVNARFDAMPGDQHRQLIHAERKNIHQATHQVNMGEGRRLVSILHRSPRRGGGSTGSAENSIGTTHNEAT